MLQKRFCLQWRMEEEEVEAREIPSSSTLGCMLGWFLQDSEKYNYESTVIQMKTEGRTFMSLQLGGTAQLVKVCQHSM